MAGFTIAEILIAMGILGVIAALTIPMMLQAAQNRELVSQYLKVHNTLTNAYKETEAVEGLKLYQLTPSQFKTAFESHLKVIDRQNCGDGMEVCLADGSGLKYECDTEGSGSTAGDQNQTQSETQTTTPSCHSIIVDTNGKKKPDADGKDRYEFLITERGLVSEGENDYCEGLNCGNYVMAHHKLFDGIVENCATYTDGKCSACQDGFSKNGNSCNKVNLTGCNDYTGVACKTCGDGYKLNTGACDKVNIEGCQTYSGEVCSDCKNSRYKNNGTSCVYNDTENCLSFEDGLCISCQANNYVRNGKCNATPEYCIAVGENGDTCTLKDGSTGYSIGNSFVAMVGAGSYPSATRDESVSMQQGGWSTDYWTGAKNVCKAKGLRLPTRAEFAELYAKRDQYPDAIPSSGIYWSSDSYNFEGSYYFDFAEGPSGKNTYEPGVGQNFNAVANTASRVGAFCIE